MKENTTPIVTVEATTCTGQVKTFSGDTAIIFTVEKAAEFLKGEAKVIEAGSAYIGANIPEEIFANTIANLICNIIKRRYEDNPMLASYNLDKLSDLMRDESQKLEEKIAEMDKDEFVKNVLKMLLD